MIGDRFPTEIDRNRGDGLFDGSWSFVCDRLRKNWRGNKDGFAANF